MFLDLYDSNLAGLVNCTETGHLTLGQFPPALSPRTIPPMKIIHGNNVVWLCAKYALPTRVPNPNASEASYKPEQRREEVLWGELPVGEMSGTELSRGGSAREGKGRGELPGGL